MKKIYVGNLSFDVSETDLETTFAQFGEIDRVNLIIDRNTGKSKGFAFISYTTEEAVQSALQFDGSELDGRKVRVSVAREKEAH